MLTRNGMLRSIVVVLVAWLGGFVTAQVAGTSKPQAGGEAPLRLGKFSVSLAVKDIAASRAFYEKLGFHQSGGDEAKGWLVLQNDTSTIGLFQGFITKNTLTFNPGWDRSNKPLGDFDDIRSIQQTLKSRGLTLSTEVKESTSGPAGLTLLDPDGNPIIVDQFVPSPKK